MINPKQTVFDDSTYAATSSVKQNIVTVSTTDRVGTFGWQHSRAWRQLAILWQIRVSHRLSQTFSTMPEPARVCSIAIAREEYDTGLLQYFGMSDVPVAIFLDRVRLRDTAKLLHVEPSTHYISSKRRHVFCIEQGHRLVDGLPKHVTIFGEVPLITPLAVGDGSEVLVSLNGVPIITFDNGRLIVGANPWQFGVPGVPMLYKVISNWLREVGCPHKLPEPCAAVRLDDLPVTAEQLTLRGSARPPNRQSARVIRRLRKFGRRTGAKFTLMYSSHFRDSNGRLAPIASIVPRSIRQIQKGIREGVFEIGSHGMIHLRQTGSPDLDPREFLDLDEEETKAHLDRSEQEILQLFGGRPHSFVAPAWGYRQGVTKRLAAQRYTVIIDSSQHVESGICDVFLAQSEDGGCANFAETFRLGGRMLSYGAPEFWACYASVGIPIHFMQHTDRNWYIVRDLIKHDLRNSTPNGNWTSTFLQYINDPNRPFIVRAICSALLVTGHFGKLAASRHLLWRALTRGSIYAFVRAMQSSGYHCITLAELYDRVVRSGIIVVPCEE